MQTSAMLRCYAKTALISKFESGVKRNLPVQFFRAFAFFQNI